MQTYATKSTARRGAVRALDIENPMEGEHFTIQQNEEGRFYWHRIQTETKSAPKPLEQEEMALEVEAQAPEADVDEPIIGHFIYCPICHTHLGNGYGVHGEKRSGKTFKHEKYEYVCLACGGEFGPEVEHLVAPVKPEPTEKKKVEFVNKSSCENPVKKVWDLADLYLAEAKKQGLDKPKRGEVIAAAEAQGVATHTARTQYQHWYKAHKEAGTFN